MSEQHTIQGIKDAKVVGIIRATSADHAVETGRALLRGGLSVIEVSFNTPNALHAIETLAQDGEGIIGAGTVLDPKDVPRVAQTGATFLVAPNLNPGVVEAALEEGLVVAPGVFTPTETALALSLGAQLLKLFPAAQAGFEMMKAISEPLPEAQWIAAGGIAFDEIPRWINGGAVAVGLGSSLTGANPVEAYERAIQLSKIVSGISH